MSSYTPDTDLWLERSRLDGMLLGAVSYGMFFVLTIQATTALTQRPRGGSTSNNNRWMLLAYVWITFVLATLDYWINIMALSCYYIMEWFMQLLLLHRCFVIWNWQKYIVIPVTTLFLAMVAMSILILAECSGVVFYDINTQLAYLALEVGLTVVYTFLVSGRLLALRQKMKAVLGKEHVHTYEAVVTMVVESAAVYTALGMIFIVSFALHSNISNLVFLAISHVQGIAQLLIIIRVAQGRAFRQDWTTSRSLPSIAFDSSQADASTDPEGSNQFPLTPATSPKSTWQSTGKVEVALTEES
ncbi:hypothetical protein BU15DRAFT_88819 [Melanogaster broomeanus]|nr:hypothetical protein BU15DRAFT_88819 [Melanogaster broomeanus]